MSTKTRKRVAVLVGHPEEYAYELFLKGFISEAFEYDMDVCVFAMHVKYQNSSARSVGDSSIFTLINYDAFDCVVVLADSIQTKGVAHRIEEDLRKSYKGKVLFVDQESEFFPSIHIDNYNPEKKIVDHLIEVHGKRDIAFLTGKAWHPHSKIRLQAYRDSLTEHGIEVNENRIFYGDFWYTSGESLADSLTADDITLPEAVAFANDHMALGFAKRMDEKGIRIPADIAIAGFDSNVDGKHAPVPLTSVPIPSVLLGRNAANYADALITGKEYVPLTEEPELFIGGTCGCGCDSVKPVYELRDRWDTEMSLGSMFSPFNFMDDDLMTQNTYNGLVATIFGYLHLIRGFDSFSLCLNPKLGGAQEPYEVKISHTIKCGADEKDDRIQTDVTFPREVMLPELYEEHEKPSVYYFLPLYYEDTVFGYGAVRYEGRVALVSPEYRAWLRSVARGIECYRRSDVLIGSSMLARQAITTDSLTGLLNYKGFLEGAENFINFIQNNGGHVGVLAIDIKDLSDINDNYGRTEGDNAIMAAASVLESVFRSRNCMCFRAGNDELVALRVTRASDDSELLSKKDLLIERMQCVKGDYDLPYNIVLYYGTECGSPQTPEELERLVNMAIAHKNMNKGYIRRGVSGQMLSEEDMQKAQVVKEILDKNLIRYHFQPIVDARTAEVVAYEALMRATVTPYLDPPTVLRFAEFYGRLYDVERATFIGVIKSMSTNEGTLSGGKKIFINSIPGYLLEGEDLETLAGHMEGHPNSIVVELTEHAELEDEDLKNMKKTYEAIGIETAVDDYGTGYSNVSNLLRYLPNYVKIDRTLLSGIEDSPQKRHFVKEIIEFSHDNGIKALAEGVETAAELKTVIMLGADLIQGYYIGMPAPEMVQSINSQVVDEIHRFDALRNSKR